MWSPNHPKFSDQKHVMCFCVYACTGLHKIANNGSWRSAYWLITAAKIIITYLKGSTSLPWSGAHTKSRSPHILGTTHALRPRGGQGHSEPPGLLSSSQRQQALQTAILSRAANVSQQTGGENIRLEVATCLSSSARTLADGSEKGARGGGGRQQRTGPVALRISPSSTPHPSTEPAQPDWASFPTSSLASVALPGFASHSGNSDGQDGCFLSPARVCFCCLHILSLQSNPWWASVWGAR